MPNWIKTYKIDIYKDLVFWPIATLWLIGNIVETYYAGEAFFVNMFYIMFMSVLILIKTFSKKSNNWLNTPLKK